MKTITQTQNEEKRRELAGRAYIGTSLDENKWAEKDCALYKELRAKYIDEGTDKEFDKKLGRMFLIWLAAKSALAQKYFPAD